MLLPLAQLRNLNSNRLSDVPSDAFSELKNIKYL